MALPEDTITTAMSLKDWMQAAGILVGMVGGCFGIASFFITRRAQKIGLKVSLVAAKKQGESFVAHEGYSFLLPACIRVYNVSNYDVTLAEYGIAVADPELTILVPEKQAAVELGVLPAILKARQACLLHFYPFDVDDLVARHIKRVFVKTDEGREFKMSRSQLRNFKLHYDIKKSARKRSGGKREVVPGPKTDDKNSASS